MKKHLIFALGLSLVAGSLTACHDDDDDDSDGEISTFVSPYIQYNPINGLSNKAGINSYILSDDAHHVDVYHFSTDDLVQYLDSTSEETRVSPQAMEALWNGFYGGFTPKYADADNEEVFEVPISKAYHSSNGAGALLVNPGTACRSLFSKHYPMEGDLSSLAAAGMAALTMGDAREIWVAPTDAFNALVDKQFNESQGLDIKSLPANHKIEVVLYGYIKSFKFGNFKEALNSIKNAGTQIGEGGTPCPNVAVLAESDKDGNVTINKEWQKIDLSEDKFGHHYVFEVSIRVRDYSEGESGKNSEVFTIDGENNSSLGYFFIDDITFESKGLGKLF